MEHKAYICENCYKNKEKLPYVFPLEAFVITYNNICRHCGSNEIRQLTITEDEMSEIIHVSRDPDFVLAMDKLKQDNIIEFNIKMTQFKESLSQPQTNAPKCPTCGSTNIKKISATKRWVGTGLFGIASSDMGKTMQCNNCGYKW